jgi:GntR family transcriptional regulator
MYIAIDHKSNTPLYLQLKDQLSIAVAMGVLQPGDQLPTVRDFAVRLRLNPNTVARVYRELQAEGLFTSRHGSGTFVADDARPIGRYRARVILRQRMREAGAMAHSLGFSMVEFRRLAEEAWREAHAGPEEGTPDER